MKDLREKTKLIPVAFVLGYIPFIVRMHEYDSHFEDQEWFPVWDDGIMFDFFLYYKAAAVLITAAVMLFILIFDARKNGSFEKLKIWKRKWRPCELLLAGYLLAVLISGVVSRYRKPAFSGSAETFEPVPVILAYGVIFYYTACFVRSDDSARAVLKMALPGFLITGLTAVLQFFKADPFKSSLIKTLIIPGGYAQLKGDLAFTFAPGEVYATLFNSNYVPQYFGFAFFIGAFTVFGKGLKLSERITGAAAALISLISIAGSRSRTGYIAVVLTVLLFLALYINELMARKGISKGKRAGVFIMLTVLIAAGCLCLLQKDTDRKLLKKAGAVSDEEAEKLIKDVKTGEDCVEIVTGRQTLSVTYEIEAGAFYAEVEGSESGTYPLSLTDDQAGFV
ncbi:MAG: O-antigen ligase family protein, partial [Lachnospiraceae bacterium]|nr:O-antigen ligase family protein [Lachnospiraceae bacterium]